MTHTRILSLPFWRAKRMALAVLPHVSSDDVTPVLTMADVQGPYLVGTDRYSVGRFTLQDPDTAAREPDPKRIDAPVKYGGVSRERHAAEHRSWEEQTLVTMAENGESVTEFAEPNFFIPRGALQRLSTLHKGLTLHSPERARVRITLTGLTSAGSLRESPQTPYLTVDVVEPLGADESMVTLSQTWVAARGNYPPVGRLVDQWEPDEGEGGARFSLMPHNLGKISRFAGRYEPFVLEAGKGKTGGKQYEKLGPMRVKIGTDFVALLQPNLLMDR